MHQHPEINVCVCVCVCEREREREKERTTSSLDKRQTKKLSNKEVFTKNTQFIFTLIKEQAKAPSLMCPLICSQTFLTNCKKTITHTYTNYNNCIISYS